jgi:hypothetical protein
MQSLSKSDEQSLLDGVKKAADLVDNQGLSPNAALQKVAEEFQYSPGFLKAACNAFNNGRQLAQWNANDSVLDKLAGFPLANYDEVHHEMWGDTQEKVASVARFGPKFETYADEARRELLHMDLSRFEKSASYAPEVHPLAADYQGAMRVKLAYNRMEWERRQAEESRRLKVASEDQLNFRVHLLGNYFQKFSYDRLPLAQIEHGAATYYGEPGKALMGYIATRFPQEKRAADHQPSWEGFHQAADRSSEPYTLISACIQQAQVHNQMTDWSTEAEEKLAAAEGDYQSFIQPRSAELNGSQFILTPSLIADGSGEKKASVLSGLAGGAGLGIGRNFEKIIGGNPAADMEAQIQELESPEHLNELRKIRAQTVLTQLMSDPEGPLSSYDPEEVLTAYNEMIQLSPRLADQPAAIAPLLNRRLMGNPESFEVGEQLNLEKGLKDVQAPQGSQAKPTKSSQVDLMKNEASILS